MKRVAVILAGICICFGASSQVKVNLKDSLVGGVLIGPAAGVYLPMGDFKERTPVAFQIGGSAWYKFKKNWLVGFSGGFLFSETASQPRLMDNIYPIISGDGSLPPISVGMRGFTLFANAGKIVPISKKPNRNSGLVFMLGAGFLQHKIRVEVRGLVPQAQGEYLKGYDRLTNGFAMSQFIGYLFLGNDKAVNFFAGIDIMEAFTKNRRGFNYDTGAYDTKSRVDVLFGFRAGWLISIYKSASRNEKKVKEYEAF